MIDGWMDGADGTQDDTGRPGKLERQITKKAKRIEIPLWVRSARKTKVKGEEGRVGECAITNIGQGRYYETKVVGGRWYGSGTKTIVAR